MPTNLVIVESPAKAKTIEKFLGSDYKVMSSYGHIRDLHTKDFSIDVEHGFTPIYEIPDDKRDVVRALRKAATAATTVWLASDEDREGEAIAWHLYEVLQLTPEKTRRIVFHEITKPAILEAIEHPREIDLNLVDAQQARRVLDRIVGFELSPVLWKKIKPGLSAGRVQSVSVRLIADREKEIRAFHSETYYRVTAQFTTADGNHFNAELSRRLKSRDEAVRLLEGCINANFTIGEVTVKPVKKAPAPPFTTSTLQQEAARKLGMTVSQTMRVAQSLYEAGHITYMRTDSVNLSRLALGSAAQQIKQLHGERYLHLRHYHTTSKGAQEAHEAIRPTYMDRQTITGTAQEKRLYSLIWKRTMASQMADAEMERTTAEIHINSKDLLKFDNNIPHFVANGEVLKFDGFLKVYIESTDDDTHDEAVTLPTLKTDAQVQAVSIDATQRFTQQPQRYTEASLVRRLEELGIGRPSTYAPTISTIQDREYVKKGESKGEPRQYEIINLTDANITTTQRSEQAGAEKGKLLPTDIGMVVNDFLLDNFPNILDYNFTAQVETTFDEIAEGKDRWNDDISKFYDAFHPQVQRVSGLRQDHKVGERMLGVDPATGQPVSVKIGRHGPMVQMGSSDDDAKPRFASLEAGQSIFSLTLEQALKLFELPRSLGEADGETVTAAVGRYGPYVKRGNTYASIPKDISVYSITLAQALDLFVKKEQEAASRVIRTFDEEPELQVINGRFGPYIAYKGTNYKLPRKTDMEALTLEHVRAIVADQSNAAKPAKSRRTSRK